MKGSEGVEYTISLMKTLFLDDLDKLFGQNEPFQHGNLIYILY